ncbi:MAG TPA: bifunctional DNA-formamidopyrimidine glycosylase/DNA-(apurinic or apyrimidinic site) lyase [Gemmatimonadaceae bacterium]|nr:bifunctional DNA-formamidopyrimidine glycosylase/DNA-(apurinic or apyrimidinic site) lyase [Gemmatimonadaceae bacterium]
MPELPEVERAMRRLRKAVEGKTISAVRALHPALARQLPDDKAALLIHRQIVRVERRGKHQLLHLDDGSSIHAHFRMNGDWLLSRTDAEPDKFTRALIDLSDGTRIELNDRRALSAMSFHPAGDDPLPALGIEANDPALDAAYLRTAVKSKRGPIKPALMDQKVIAGLGNIYAAEALWRAKISPRAIASSLSVARLQRLVDAIREVLTGRNRPPGRYTETRGRHRFGVYDRAGDECGVCGSTIRRIVQAGRSTYYCPKCQKT